MLANALLTVFVAAFAMAAIKDLLTMTIPNWISILLAAVFPVLALAAGLPWQDLFSHIGAGAIVLVAGIAMFAAGVFGGGDAKLLAAASLWVGFDQLMPLMFHVAMFGGALAVLILLYRRMPEAVAAGGEWSLRLHDKSGGIPYGIAISIATLVVFPKTALFALIIG